MLVRGVVRRRVRASIAYGEILTAERMGSRIGFRFHGRGWEKLIVVVGRSGLRTFEEKLRAGGVMIVDQYGARIDESQFEKEADPKFNTRFEESIWSLLLVVLTPNAVHRWRYRRSMRQWSDDAESE